MSRAPQTIPDTQISAHRATWPPDRIAAGVVLYQPPPAAVHLIAALRDQFDRLFIADNAASRLQSAAPGIEVISNKTNRGLAAAINQLCAAALQAGYDWLILFDQDSRIPADFRARFNECCSALDRPPALLAANYVTELCGTAFTGYLQVGGGLVGEMTVALNSGSLLDLAIHRDLGGHDESFFVDHADHEYCLRLRRRGHAVYGTRAALFEHEIGEVSCVRCCGRIWQSSGHSVERRREWAYNLVRLVKRYRRTAPAWCARRIFIDLPKNLIAIVLLEQNRAAKVKAVLAGLYAGFDTQRTKRR